MFDYRPQFLNGVCINGCREISDAGRARLEAAKDVAVPFSLLWNETGSMPVIKWDDDLLTWIGARAEFLDAARRRGKNPDFWTAFDVLPKRDKKSDVLCWNQGSVPSCCLTATSHAVQASTLIATLLGAPVRYDAVNPIYAHYVSLGGRMNSGQDCYSAASFVNEKGVYPVSAVGDNNINTPSDSGRFADTALKNRVAVAFFKPDPATVFLLARAGLPFVFGSAQFCTAASLDKNGLAVGGSWTSGAHAEMGAAAYRRAADGTEYAYVQNSHGDNYTRDETGHTASGYWLTEPGWERLCQTMPNYGDPFIVLPRADISERLTFVPNGLERRAS